ncbi:MAG: alpha/beta hydrolase [Rhodobacter sp.]|nr:alpha/beta hydrolase [Rhodobacter sp.]
MMDPLVILPGFLSDARGFLPQIVHLGADRQVTVILPQGETVEQMSLAAIRDLPRRFALLGHGLGGDVAIDILRRLPEAVTRIALIATDPLAEPPAVAASREARLVAARAGRLAEAVAGEFPATALADTEWQGEVLALVQDMAAGLGPETYVRQTRALQRRPDQQKTLRKVRTPALILAGEADSLVPVRRQEFMAGLMPFGRLQVIAGAGHLPQLEQPEAVSAALRDFLAGPMLLR